MPIRSVQWHNDDPHLCSRLQPLQAAEYWTWLGNLRDSSSFTKAAFTALGGVIPALISSISSYALPYMVRWLDKWSGGLSRGALDKAVVRRLYWFEIVRLMMVSSQCDVDLVDR